MSHALREGTAKRLTADALIDLELYSRQAGKAFSDTREAYRHFRETGQRAGLLPSPWFYTRWYAWQNPGAARHPTVLDHFLAESARGPVDPAPFVDMVGLLRRAPDTANALVAYCALLSGRDLSISPDLEHHLDALATSQRLVHGAVRSAVLKQAGAGERNRLVWAQIGQRARLWDWFDPGAPRSWDLMCNWYTDAGLDLRHGEVHLRQSGTKFTAIHHVLETRPELLAGYEQIIFIDDDLVFANADLDRLFDIARHEVFDLFQATLEPGSFCVWPELFRRPGVRAREMTAVEIMMFGFSRRALETCAPHFASSVSGFGLDVACAHAVRAAGWRCGAIDAVGVRHETRIDEGGGAYYNLMRKLGINQKLELFTTILKTGELPTFATVTGSTAQLPRAEGFAGAQFLAP